MTRGRPKKQAERKTKRKCNLCERVVAMAKFQRFCRYCKYENDSYRFAGWMTGGKSVE